jgi:amidase
MQDLWRLSAAEMASLIRSKKVSAKEAATAALARLDAVNPRINAVVDHKPADVLAQAAAIDAAIGRGEDAGPLAGVPITVKANIDQEGFATTNGLKLQRDAIAKSNSPVIDNLRKAGAVILGRTNCPAFSYRWFTTNLVHGDTRNPRDPGITPGGSSGGAGAAVAAGIGHIAHGTDIAGSIRYPAYACGVHGLRPTMGRIPAFNAALPERPIGPQISAVSGPLARTIGDLRIALAAMSARDYRDPWWVPAPLEGPSPAKPIKVALARIPDDMETDAAVLALLRTAAGHLVDAGYDVVETEVPDLTGTWRLWCDLIMTELSVLQEAQMRELGSADFRQTLDGFLKMATILDRRGYMEAIAHRSRVLRDWLAFLEVYPVMLTPLSVKRTPEANADLGGDARVRSLFWNDLRFMSSINVLGLPAAVVPIGLVAGNPVGVQLIGSRYREDVCLDAAATIEAKVGIMAKRLWERI